MGIDLSTQSGLANPLLRVRGLEKHYVRGGLWGTRVRVAALKNVNFEICVGETVGLVGESGSGKSTLARCVARVEEPDSGQILIDGKDIAARHRTLLSSRELVQLIFQDAVTSMNPHFTAAQVVEEPLLIQGEGPQSRREKVRTAMNETGLPAEWMARPVMEFSGGQRQRIAIARALVIRPKLLVLDEALTGLDLSTQAQIANLLLDLQAAHALTYLLISHDVTLVARMADKIAVMASGRIVESGPTSKILTAPQREETIRLLASARTAQENLAAITGGSE
jgi:peptide/nickel transport system ATP-binding protein